MMTEPRASRQTTAVCDSHVGSAAMPQRPDARRLAAEALFVALLPLWLSRSDWLVATLPSVGLLRGPAAFVFLGLVIAVTVARALGPEMAEALEQASRQRAAFFFLMGALVY